MKHRMARVVVDVHSIRAGIIVILALNGVHVHVYGPYVEKYNLFRKRNCASKSEKVSRASYWDAEGAHYAVPAKTEFIKQISMTHETIVQKYAPTAVPLWRPLGLLRVLRPLAIQPLLQQFSRGPMRGHLRKIRQHHDKCAGKL